MPPQPPPLTNNPSPVRNWDVRRWSWARKALAALLLLVLVLVGVFVGHDFRRTKYLALNSRLLDEVNQSTRVSAHRVNSASTARDLWERGVRSFEVDVRYKARSDRFVIGHDAGDDGGTLEAYLEGLPPARNRKLWLDFKNLKDANCKAALARLATLDRKFALRAHTIVESSSKSRCFRNFRDDGWHTSYYLPTRAVLSLLEQQDAPGLSALSRAIAQQVETQSVSAVSFDVRLYPFVEGYLGDLLDEQIAYHLWDLSLEYYDGALISKLKTKAYFSNQRVKTILLSQHSLLQYLGMKRDRVVQLLSRGWRR